MDIDSAVDNTIKYAHKFGSYVNSNEIGERLLSKKIFNDETIVKSVKGIKNKKDRYFYQKSKKASELAKEIEKKFKDILFLGVSGSVASRHPKKDDDIDFLVITKKNKLWKTRLFVRWWIFKNKIPHRRYGQKERKDEFCFNLWLDEDSLLLPKNRCNLRNAVDLVLLKPLINKDRLYEKFILINKWAKKWVATPYENKISNFQFLISKKNEKSDKLNEIINRMYFWPQYCYMRWKNKQNRVGLHEAFFHKPMVK